MSRSFDELADASLVARLPGEAEEQREAQPAPPLTARQRTAPVRVFRSTGPARTRGASGSAA
jgi:hypothetical protein